MGGCGISFIIRRFAVLWPRLECAFGGLRTEGFLFCLSSLHSSHSHLANTHHIFRKFALGEVVISYQHQQRHHHLALSSSPHSPIHTHIHYPKPIPIPILIQATQQIWIWIQWAGLAAQPTSDKVSSDAICKGSMWATMEEEGERGRGRRGNCYNSWRHCLRDKTQNSTSFSQEICQPFSSLLLGTWHNGDNMEISAEGGLQTNWGRETVRKGRGVGCERFSCC